MLNSSALSSPWRGVSLILLGVCIINISARQKAENPCGCYFKDKDHLKGGYSTTSTHCSQALSEYQRKWIGIRRTCIRHSEPSHGAGVEKQRPSQKSHKEDQLNLVRTEVKGQQLGVSYVPRTVLGKLLLFSSLLIQILWGYGYYHHLSIWVQESWIICLEPTKINSLSKQSVVCSCLLPPAKGKARKQTLCTGTLCRTTQKWKVKFRRSYLDKDKDRALITSCDKGKCLVASVCRMAGDESLEAGRSHRRK